MRWIKNMSFLLLLIMSSAMAWGAIAVDNPKDGDTLNGTIEFNVTFADIGTANCTIDGSSSITGDTFKFVLVNETIIGNDLATANTSTITEVDASDWILTPSCQNATGASSTESVATITVTINNTVPILTSFSPADLATDADGDINFSVACANATAATVIISGSAFTMTEDEDVCYFEAEDLSSSTHTWTVEVSDGLDLVVSASQTVRVLDAPGGFTPTQLAAKEKAAAGDNNFMTFAIIGVVAFLLFGGGKKVFKARRKKR